MFRRKIYGSSQVLSCPFCGKTAITKNPQAVPVCSAHIKALIDELKCVCGSWLDIREGKYGAFCLCANCGPMNLRKALEINDGAKIQQEQTKISQGVSRPSQVTPAPSSRSSYEENTHTKPYESSGYQSANTSRKSEKKETIVRSDELDFL